MIQAINTQSVLNSTFNQLRDEAASQPSDGVPAEKVSFTAIMESAIHSIDSQQHEAASKMTAVEVGKSDDLVGAMVASQKAGLSFSALVQVRNRLVSGFDEIMRMPV